MQLTARTLSWQHYVLEFQYQNSWLFLQLQRAHTNFIYWEEIQQCCYSCSDLQHGLPWDSWPGEVREDCCYSYARVPHSGKRLPIPPVTVFWHIQHIPAVEGRVWEKIWIHPVKRLYHKMYNLINNNVKPNHIGLDRGNNTTHTPVWSPDIGHAHKRSCGNYNPSRGAGTRLDPSSPCDCPVKPC